MKGFQASVLESVVCVTKWGGKYRHHIKWCVLIFQYILCKGLFFILRFFSAYFFFGVENVTSFFKKCHFFYEMIEPERHFICPCWQSKEDNLCWSFCPVFKNCAEFWNPEVWYYYMTLFCFPQNTRKCLKCPCLHSRILLVTYGPRMGLWSKVFINCNNAQKLLAPRYDRGTFPCCFVQSLPKNGFN